jgi:hypothetical protein
MLPVPDRPVHLALIGAGHRSQTIYRYLFDDLKPWIELTAVVDPVREHADLLAETLGVKAFYDVRDLVQAGACEAAVAVVPIPLHYAYSVYRSRCGIHNMLDTTWCSTLEQARLMVKEAKDQGVVTGVCENFYRYPIDRFAQTLRDSGYIGDIKRIFCYNDHTGYHSDSRWLVFADEMPDRISAMEHDRPTMPFYESPQRFHDHETFRSRFIHFPSGLMVIDQAANIKGMLGRQARPGFTEWHGTMGTLAQSGGRYQAPDYRVYDNNRRVEAGKGVHSDWTAEIRRCDYPDTLAFSDEVHPGQANVISKVERFYDENGAYAGVRACIPGGEIVYHNPLVMKNSGPHYFREYGVCVAAHLADFALCIRGVKQQEFGEDKALMSMMMEAAARESILKNGAWIDLPLIGPLKSDALALDALSAQLGQDPMDVEKMLSFQHDKP